jgi:HK97 family phage major capsid protein
MTLAERILQAKQERANVNIQIRGIMDEFAGKEMDSTKNDELRKLEERFDKLNEDTVRMEKQLERDRITGEGTKPIDEPGQRGQEQKPDKETQVRELFTGYLRSGTNQAMEQYRALQQDNPTQAGYLVAPQQFVGEVIQEKNNLTFMRQICRVLPALEKAQSLGYPKRTSRMSTFAWGTEIKAPTADTSLAFGKREFIPKPGTGGILVSKTLVRNSAIDIQSYIKSEMAYNQATNEEQAFFTGNGVIGPLGVFTASADGISTDRDVSTDNTATAITFDGLKNAKYSIKEQYQNGLTWAFHRDGVKMLAKIKDSEGQYVWADSVKVGEPDMLLSYPVRMSEYIPNTFTTGKYVGILGNFKDGYWICDSLTMEMQTLLELYALTNQVFYIARAEVDGMPVLEECFARIKLG